jgi:RNA polymerase sigma factor (sigma-70 family)
MLPTGRLSRVYFDTRPALQRFLAQKTNCPETAADLVQEIYLRLPQLTPIPASESKIRAWLFRVASNMAIDHFRAAKRQSELLSGYASNSDLSYVNPSPEQTILQMDQLLKLQSALAELPPVCTEVLYLSRIEGLTHQAIADRLDISISWVEKQLVRALDHCRKTMNDD